MALHLRRPRFPHVSPNAFILACLVALPMVFNAVMLWPEVSLPVPNVNDDAEHIVFIFRASDALAAGEHLLDHWLPQLDLGFPEFFYYQHLPHVAVVVLHRALFGLVPLDLLFNAVRWVLLVSFPVTVWWSMRRMGFDAVAAATGAMVSSLFSGDHRYGFEYDSYVWRGFGMYTQLWAMHLSMVCVACVYRLLDRDDGLRRTIVALAALALSHLIYAYMFALTCLLLVATTLRRASWRVRLLHLAGAGGAALLISSYLWVPFLLRIAYLSTSPYLQPEKFTSYGAQAVFGWLVTGDLFDHGRLPVVTALVLSGIVAAGLRRRRLHLFVVALFGFWLWLYSGRDAIGPLYSILPLHESLLFHRFVGGVDVAAIMLAGIATSETFRAAARGRSRLSLRSSPIRTLGVGLLTALVLMLPALAERASYYQQQASWMISTLNAIDQDQDLHTILSTLRRRPEGRVYAGLRSNWGRRLDLGLPFNSVHVYQLLTAEGFSTVAPPYGGQSLNADLQFDFDDQRSDHYDLFAVRYVIAPPDVRLPERLSPLAVTRSYVLYEATGVRLAQLAGVTGTESVQGQTSLFRLMRGFVLGTAGQGGMYVRFDYLAGSLPDAPTSLPRCPSGDVSDERVEPARMEWTMSCPSATAAVIKVTFHPNWRVSVDGVDTRTFMVSPSYLAFELAPGTHRVVATYRSDPTKGPLLVLGALTIGAMALTRRRIWPFQYSVVRRWLP